MDTREQDDTHEPPGEGGVNLYGRPLIIQTGRAKGYRLNDPAIRKFWTETEWDEDECFGCGYLMDTCDCPPGQVGTPQSALCEAAEGVVVAIEHAVRRAKDVRPVFDGTNEAHSFDAVLQMLEHAQGVMHALAQKRQ